MSNRTLLEINHDYAHAIMDDPEGFAAALHSYLRSGSVDYGVEFALSRYGVSVGPMRHHSSPEPFVRRRDISVATINPVRRPTPSTGGREDE